MRLPFITHTIQHLHELNNSKTEPHLHKRHYLSTSKKLHILLSADDQVIIADSEDN
jgi:hypothetical protein